MKIYGDLQSGNCLKVKYTADHLGLTYSWVPVDITKGESRSADYLRLNPQGQVPAIELDDGRRLGQSNAIIRYLARDSALLPVDAFAQAKVDELLFWEQYSHEPYIAVCRYQMFYLGKPKEAREAWRVERGEKALDYMDGRLQGCGYLVNDQLTIADISLLAYTRLATEGGFDLGAYGNVRAWIERCEKTLGLGKVH
jgi:glutathione S-transferase